MLWFKKKAISYKTEDIENIIGVGLPNRNQFINYGDVSANNIYSGYAIGRVFAKDQNRLSFEFDAVYLHYLMSELVSSGIPSEQSDEALRSVFDNFELSAAEQKQFHRRLGEYASLSDPDIADKFISNLGVEDFPDNFRIPSRKILGEQFGALSKTINKFVGNELRASRV